MLNLQDVLFINENEGLFLVSFRSSYTEGRKEIMSVFDSYQDCVNFIKDFLVEGAFDLCEDEVYNMYIEYNHMEEELILSPMGFTDPTEDTLHTWGENATIL